MTVRSVPHFRLRDNKLTGESRPLTDLKSFFTAESAEVRRGFIGYCTYGAVNYKCFLCEPLRSLRFNVFDRTLLADIACPDKLS